VRVYWEDTDAGGVVYHTSYLRFLERARTEWLRARGICQHALSVDPGVLFTVVNLQAHFQRAARLDDLLAVSCEPRRQGGASIAFSQRIWLAGPGAGPGGSGSEDGLLLHASVRVACLDARTMKPRRLPPVIVQNLSPRSE
jgi:acyl-CoA thioester hydrolase